MRKMAILLIAFAVLFAFSEVTQAGKQQENFQAIEWQNLPFEDFNKDTSVVGTWNDEEYVIRIQMLSLDLDMKLVFDGKGSNDFTGTPYGNDPPNLGKILKCKELPEYPGNTTCLEYQVYKRKLPGLVTQAWDFTATMMKKTWSLTVTTMVQAWRKCCNGIVTMVGKIWNGLKGMVEWIVNRITWFAEWLYNGSFWLAESIWNNTVWLAKLTWNRAVRLAEWAREQTPWLAEVARESSLWLAEKTWTGCKWLAECTWKKAKWLANWTWKAAKRNCKPLDPTIKYVLETVEVVTMFYTENVHEHLINIQANIIVSTWRDAGYTISSAMVMNCVVVAVYKLISCPVKCIWRRWQDYKAKQAAEAASWMLPPKRSQQKKRVWENPKKRKLYRNK